MKYIETKREFKIYRVDFGIGYRNPKTGEPTISEYKLFNILGINKKGSLVIETYYGEKIWIKEKYFNSSNSPMWKETSKKNYGYIIREQTIDFDVTEITAFLSLMTINYN